MTPKQEAFVREYLIDLDASKAVIRAGYHAQGQRAAEIGYQLLQKTPVQSAIQAAMGKRAERVEVNADTVLKNIIEIGQRCMQREPVFVGRGKDRKQAVEFVTDPETGQEVLAQVFQFDSQGALKAQELLGKHLKLFTDKTEITGKDGKDLFSPDQVLRMAEEIKMANRFKPGIAADPQGETSNGLNK